MSADLQVDERIRARLEERARRLEPSRTGAEVLPDIRARARRRALRRRVGRSFAATAASAAAIVAAVALWPGEGGGGAVRTGEPADRPSSSTTAPPTTEQPDRTPLPDGANLDDLPAPPLDLRWKHATVWTGRELVVWGGELDAANMGVSGPSVTYNDGAAYDPNANRWRTMSESPLPGDSDPGGGIGGGGTATAVWTGDEVLVVQAGQAAAWDPDTDRWREVAPPPGEAVTPQDSSPDDLLDQATHDLFVAASDVVVLLRPGEAWAWRPDRDEWSRLPDPPIEILQGAATWTGEEVIHLRGSWTGTDEAGAAYDPSTGRWREIPGTPTISRAAVAAWTGDRVIVAEFDATRRAAAYVPADNTWRDLPSIPLPHNESIPSLVVVGDSPVVSSFGTAMLVDGLWHPLPAAPDPLGDAVAGAGTVWSAGPDMTASPPTMALSAFRPPTPAGLLGGGAPGDEDAARQAVVDSFTTVYSFALPDEDRLARIDDPRGVAEGFAGARDTFAPEVLAQVSIEVHDVAFIGPDAATVRYDLLTGQPDASPSDPAFTNLTGQAVLVDGGWRVTRGTVCNVLASCGA